MFVCNNHLLEHAKDQCRSVSRVAGGKMAALKRKKRQTKYIFSATFDHKCL